MTSTPATAAPQVSPAKVAAPVGQLVALDLIHPDPNQPRKKFDEAALKDLADSIRTEGLVQPMVVRPNGKGYYLVAGERRLKACKLAGLKEAPVIVRTDLKDQDVQVLQMVENVQREDLTLPEQCEAVAKLVKSLNDKDGKGGQARAAAKLGKSEAWVSKRSAAETFPEPVRKLLGSGAIVDIEIAAGIAELNQVNAEDAKEAIDQVKNADAWGEPLTRDDLRNKIKWAKERKEREIKEARAKAAAAKDPKAIAARDKEAKENAKHTEKAATVRALGKACEDLADRAMQQLFPVLGFKVPKKDGALGMRGDNTPLAVLPAQYNYSKWNPNEKFPATADGAEFQLAGWGQAEHLERIAKLFGEPEIEEFFVGDSYGGGLELSFKDVLIVLKALKHHKSLGANFEIEISGAALRKLVEKHTGKPFAATAAPPLAKKAPAKPAVKKKR